MSQTVYSGRVTNWPLFGVTAVLSLAVLVGAALLTAAVVPLGVAAVALLLGMASCTSVRTTAGPQGVVVHYGLLGYPRFHFDRADIATAEAIDVPIRSMGGWGAHWSPWRGLRLTIRSGPSLRLELADGRVATISAQQPQAAVAALG